MNRAGTFFSYAAYAALYLVRMYATVSLAQRLAISGIHYNERDDELGFSGEDDRAVIS